MMKIHSATPEVTRDFGAAVARAINRHPSQEPIVIALHGEMGAGKTTFVSGLLNALGVSGPIKSPTYTLIEPYELTNRTIYHLDLYRLVSANELEMLAPRDLLEPRAVLLIEWAERAQELLPLADLTFNLSYDAERQGEGQPSTGRVIELVAGSKTGTALAAFVQDDFHKTAVSL